MNHRFSQVIASCAFLFTTAATFGVTLPHIFGNHMVLQADRPVPIWGWAKPGEAITVHFANQEKHGTAASDGHWQIHLDPMSATALGQGLTIAGANTVTITDVVVGEVWLCSGQSNMAKPVGTWPRQEPTTNFKAELEAANFPAIRFYQPKGQRALSPQPDFDVTTRAGEAPHTTTEWVVCSPVSLDALKFSAVAYFFGRKIHQELKVPVGLINASVGGTRIEPWISADGYAAVPALAEFARACGIPGAKVDDTEMCALYNGMIAPLVPFGIQGVLWYQGESNIYAGDGALYADKMTALINGWRRAWGRAFSFYYVQVAPLLYHVTRTNYVVSPEVAPRVWEAQAAAMRLPHTGMVVTTDLVDDLTNIHPPKKKPVGERLAVWALANDYHRTGLEVSGPIFSRMDISGTKAILHFDHVDGGLVAKGDRPLNWFVVAGSDGNFFPGTAAIVGDTVTVSSPKVAAPRVVRFAWDEAARPNFFNQAGLPAVPFRTDCPSPPAP